MKKIIVTLFLFLTVTQAHAQEKRCGWFHNPTPANAWLMDRDGEWMIGVQGGHQAKGDWPDFSDEQWVKRNGNYGYGCTCLDVKVNRDKKFVLEILSTKAQDLSVCENDKALGGD